jgi:hypothetical protein
MTDSQREHIQRIRDDFQASQRVKDSLNNATSKLAKDLYSKETHFIFELIQNAEDNSYSNAEPSLVFKLVKTDPTGTPNAKGALIIQNNEIGFSSENVDAICEIGKTTKNKSGGYIGEKGLGFKSVFRVTTEPHIFSNGYRFCLPEKEEETGFGYIVPLWVDRLPEGIGITQTNIILPLDKREYNYERIEGMLLDIKPETILFLSKIKQISVTLGNGDSKKISKDDSQSPRVLLLIESTRQETRRDEYLLYKRPFDKPAEIKHDERIGIDSREVSIAFPLNEKDTCRGKIFAYLPVRSDIGLPLLINADFILTSSREEIQEVSWNRWLIECVAKLIADSLSSLRDEKVLTISLLEEVVKSIYSIKEDDFFYPMVGDIIDAFTNKKLLPTNDGSFISSRNAKLASADWLRELLTEENLRELFKTGKAFKWISGDIKERTTEFLWKFIHYQLKVDEITPEGFARKIDTDFLSKRTDEWMIKFYGFVKNNMRSFWDSESYHPPLLLRDRPIIRLQNKTHVKPFKNDGSPNAYLTFGTDTETSLPIVKTSISRNNDAREFLVALKVPEWGIVAEVIERILPRYEKSVDRKPSFEKHVIHIKKIIKAYLTDVGEKKDPLKKHLRNASFVLTENSTIPNTHYMKPTDVYFRNDDLLEYFLGNKDVGFVSEKYNSSHFLEILKELGVKDSIRVECESGPGNKSDVRLDDHNKGLSGFDPDIKVDGLEHALQHISLKKAETIWNRIAINYSHCIKGIICYSSRADFSENAKSTEKKEVTSNAFGKLLLEREWLPDRDGNFHKPSELGLDDLPEGFVHNEELADKLQMKMNDIDRVAEKLKILPKILKFVKENPEEIERLMIEKEKKMVHSQEQETSPDQNAEPQSNAVIDYRAELKKSLNCPGKTNLNERLESDETYIPDRERRRRKEMEAHRERIVSEPDPEDRRQTTERTKLERPDEQVRKTLEEWYGGKCQICGDTFPERDGKPFFMAKYMVERKLARQVDANGNALCLCADHFAKWEFGAREVDDMRSQVDSLNPTSEGGNENLEIRVKLCGEEFIIKFTERHVIALQALIKASSNEDLANP